MLNNPNEIQKAHSNLLFLTERIKIDKCQKRVCNLDKKKNLSYTKKPWNRLILIKVHSVIELNQQSSLKPYVDMNTKNKGQ